MVLAVCLPCKIDDGEKRGEGVISGIPVVCDGGETVGAVLTAYYVVHKIYIHCVMWIQYVITNTICLLLLACQYYKIS